MGRTLPWKKGDSPFAVTKPSASPRGRPSPRPTSNVSRPTRTSPSSPSAAAPIRTASRSIPATPSGRSKTRQISSGRAQASRRSPSSSPLPEPIPESYMIAGFENDDRWRMVEDEFYTVAGQFTAHLHAAEYRRLKEETKKRSGNAVPDISRPVTAPSTSHVKRRQAASALAAAQRQGVKNAMSRMKVEETDDEDDETSWKGTHLLGLMNSPRKKAQPLANISSIVGGSHTAASKGRGPGSSLSSSWTSKVALAKDREDAFSSRTTTVHRAPGNIARREASQPRKSSNQSDTLDESDDGDLELHSSRQPSTYQRFSRAESRVAKTDNPRSDQAISTSSIPASGPAPKETPIAKQSHISSSRSAAAPPASHDDSDSGSETYFQRRMRERRSKRKSTRQKSSTPTELNAKDDSPPSEKNARDSQSAVFAVPSF